MALTRALTSVVLLLFAVLLTNSALAAPLTVLMAQYTVAAPPTAIAAGGTATVAVQLKNTGDEPWTNAGPNPVNLTYHWYDQAGGVVLWDGVRSPLPGPVLPGAATTVQAAVQAPKVPGSYQLRFALVKEGTAWFPPSAPFPVVVQQATYTAGYQVTAPPPSQVPAGLPLTVQVTLTNTGNQTWNTAGTQPVNVAYHWYDAAGTTAVVWDGARTPLGADVAPGGTRAVTMTIATPAKPGAYQLRIALVKEGVAWFPPSAPLAVTALAPYVASIAAPALPTFVSGGAYTLTTQIRNTGAAAWSAAGTNPVRVSYHWHDAKGATVVWDGLRTPIAADVAPGATVSVNVKVVAPAPGTYTLTLDLVREGVGWFESFGGTPLRLPASVEQVRYAASYALGGSIDAYWAETKTVPITVTNTGNQTWTVAGPNPVNLSYHILDATGHAIVWDGARTTIGADVAPGQTRTLSLAFTAPASSGTYTLVVDLVREGIGWFEAGGSPPAKVAFTVTSGLNGGYLGTTTPGQVTIGAAVDLSVVVVNYGPRTWASAGANPVSLSYHIVGAHTGNTYVWDGARGKLPVDVPAFSQATVPIRVQVPAQTGDYIIEWDLVQEGVAWFSSVGVKTKNEPLTVVSGVVFYGSGNGHGLGMSQYGAQGYATGAAGPALTGEQIIARYFPGTSFQFTDAARPYNRVLLSQPSSQSRYRCGDNAYFAGSFGDVISDGGFTVYDESAPGTTIGIAGPNQQWQFVAVSGTDIVRVYNNGGSASILVKEVHTSAGRGVYVVPRNAGQPLRFVQKDTPTHPGTYRGNFRLTNLGGTLRLINELSYDDYIRGVISFEMPKTWHPEALKAQAYAARSYAYASYRGPAPDHDYDVSDDQSSQCYAGTYAEGPTTEAAVVATAGRVVTYNGAAIRTYFSSSDGGYTIDVGCFENNVKKVNGVWQCTPDPSQPYLRALPDPADRAVTSPPNPRASWSVSFTGDEIEQSLIRCDSIDIGTLQGVDVSNQSPQGGHVISVRFIGSIQNADVQATQFLRNCLGLRSTMVRLSPL